MCMADMQPNCDNDQPNIMVLKIYLIYIVLHTFNIDDLSILMHRFSYKYGRNLSSIA